MGILSEEEFVQWVKEMYEAGVFESLPDEVDSCEPTDLLGVIEPPVES